jgi:hypothetical protein
VGYQILKDTLASFTVKVNYISSMLHLSQKEILPNKRDIIRQLYSHTLKNEELQSNTERWPECYATSVGLMFPIADSYFLDLFIIALISNNLSLLVRNCVESCKAASVTEEAR